MLKMETNNLISKAKRRLKRKRPYAADLPSLDSDLLDYDTYCNEFSNGSESSSPTSSSSSGSLDNRFDFINRKNPNKIFVTEERMAKALRELQIQTRDELKQSLRLLDKQNDDDLNKLISVTSSDRPQMQIIPYIPLNSFIDPTDVYQVEEPTDIVKKNLLKRSHSQVNKLTIEELKQSDSSIYSSKDQESKAYVVEFEEDDKNKADFKLETNDQTTYKFNFNKITKPNITITELDDNKTKIDFKDEEAMDM